MKTTILCAALVLIYCSNFANAQETDSPMAISLLSGIEAYEDSPHSSLSKGVGISFIWDDLKYDQKYQVGEHYVRARGTYYYEKDSEKYDEDRYRDSMDGKLHYQYPFMSINDNEDFTLSVFGHYEGHYNSQQLEEFEHLAASGLAINNRFGDLNYYDVGFSLGLAYSAEEKDDDWPREEQGISEDELNRSGFGYYFQWENSYTFSHTGVQLAFNYRRYDGLWKYDDNKSYTFNDIAFSVVIPLANQHNLLRFQTQYIDRESEQDLIGFEDTLYRASVEYIHYF
ncbi:hypothetical protein HWQ46_20825 [Shewanella sp. D64]|nr:MULTISPECIES: hypothetical protein [unclassified Shewanella]MEC4727984.1 hypothetical protein [Shewanella sp. D64]MEC4740044.1 hypothetical protein [Shewanella sp. E94]